MTIGGGPILSIGMPLYNAGIYLRPALDALLTQDETAFELLISDNVSTDGTDEVCREYAARDPRIRYERLGSHVGPGENFLAALNRATAPLFMWAAHDDRWEPSFVSKIVRLLQQNPDALLGFCRFDALVHATGTTMPVADWSAPPSNPFDACVTCMRHPVANLIYGIFRREALTATAWMRGGLYDFSDVFLILEIATRGSIVIVPEVLFHAGIVGGATRAPHSFAKSRRSDYHYGYGEYYRRAARLLWNVPGFSLAQRARLQAYLTGQVLSMMNLHERDTMSRPTAALLDAALRFGKWIGRWPEAHA